MCIRDSIVRSRRKLVDIAHFYGVCQNVAAVIPHREGAPIPDLPDRKTICICLLYTSFHWYSGDHFDAVRLVRECFPNKLLMFSEGCIEYSLSLIHI